MILGNVENMFDEAGNEIPDTVTDSFADRKSSGTISDKKMISSQQWMN